MQRGSRARGGFRRKLEQEKQLEEMRIEMRKQFEKKEEREFKSEAAKIGCF